MSQPAQPPQVKNKEKDKRVFCTADTSTNSNHYESNYISTTKYTALTFLPFCLLNQFKRYANIYFLMMAIIQCFPSISPINPVSSIAPLVFVISLSILREGFEDLSRHKSDLQLNSSKTAKYEKGEWQECDWKDVYVGDFVKVDNGDFFPTDMICIRSSDPEGNCFIQTSSLDGEKNLKPRVAVTETHASIENPSIIRLMGELEMDPPNSDLYSCNGTLSLGGDKKILLSVKNLLLRGAVLKNTDWVIGITAYTGKDTKIMKNAEESKSKQSQVEWKTNKLIVVIFSFQILVCIVAAILNSVWYSKNKDAYSRFFKTENSVGLEAFFLFLTMLILTGTMIPISLIVSLEMVKLVQAFFINKDQDMFFHENPENQQYCKVFTSTLNEELGQIEFIFSDKTGTLTCNKMEFKYCVIGDVKYGSDNQTTEIQQEVINEPFEPAEPQMSSAKSKEKKPPKFDHVSYNFKDSRLDSFKEGKTVGENKDIKLSLYYREDTGCMKPVVTFNNQQDLVKEFFFLLSLCHDCLRDVDDDGNVSYQGQSPDEITLVDAAKRLGFEFSASTSTHKTVNIYGKENKFRVLKYFEFNSDRKRASIIIRDNDGLIKLLVKGADSIIIDRLAPTNQPYLELLKSELTKFSTVGLRTLCMAERLVSQEEYDILDKKLLEFASDLEGREKKIGIVESDFS